jgi:curved DNA-binding protein CbpA
MARTFSSREFYEVLGVEPGFSLDELNLCFKNKIRSCHPDRFTDPLEKKQAEDETKLLTEAFNVLSDPGKRSYYDHWLTMQPVKQESSIDSLENYMPTESESELISNALYLLYNGSPLEASIRLKMALARSPGFTAARFLLGISMLEIGGTKTREGHKLVKESLIEEPGLGYLWKGTQRPQAVKFSGNS